MSRLVGAALPIVLATCCVHASAQTPAVCRGPAEIESDVAKKPSANAYNALGAWFARRNQMNCAIPAFRSAIHLNPNAWDGHFNLALALIQQRELKQAVNELRQAAKLGPGRAPIHMALGVALQEMGQLPAAETELKTAMQIDPRSVAALDHLAQV